MTHVFGCSIHKFVNSVQGALFDIHEYWMVYHELRKSKIDLGEALFNVDDIKVYCSDKAVGLSGIPKRIPGAVFGIAGDNDSVIVINRRLRDQEQWFIDGMIAHEFAHIKLHSNKRKPIINRIMRLLGSEHDEFEADLFAQELGHDMLRVLERCKELGYDVNRRILNLQH